jgi:glycosyltransferase involved in cell wall biosynthesis
MGRGKSDLKWLESSMAGAAFIGSDAKPYATVKHGRTGLLADTPQEWEEAIETLIVDDTLRLKLAHAARKHVVTNRTAQKTAYLYRKALREIRTRAGMRVAA